MCGIFGYIGANNAYEKVFEGLKLLQYRGYDSCGIAYYKNGFKITKTVGTLENLVKPKVTSNIAFGHTRWATNGKVNKTNAHPHYSKGHEFTLVHNGIIKNAEQIKQELTKEGITFYSQTDSEVISNLIYSIQGDIEQKLVNATNLLQGSYALIVGNKAGELFLIKKFCPLNIVKNEDGIYISSDKASLPSGEIYTLQDDDIIKISNNIITAINGKIKFKQYHNNLKLLYKDGFNHYMLKEIFETPSAILKTYNQIKDFDFESVLSGIEKITFIGCGTAYNSCLVGEYLLKQLKRFQTEHCLASNYECSEKQTSKHLHIIVSQSGETADCIKVAEQVVKQNGKILLITNEATSSLTNFAHHLICTDAGKEIAVASTKTYCCQLFVFEYLYNKLKNPNYKLKINDFCDRLNTFIKQLDINSLVETYKNSKHLLLIGKGVDYLILKEASLKIREIDYFYTIPMYSGELKHGTLSLVDENTNIIALDSSADHTNLQTAISEIKSRKGKVIDMQQFLPNEIGFMDYKSIYCIIPFQIFSYQLAIVQGHNPDMPKNLAKSVTVE